MRPDFHGLTIAPAIPSEWDGFTIEKDFRGKHLSIAVKNPGHVQSGCVKLVVNGALLEGNYIPEEMMTEQTKVEYYMS
jgi:cellobiose phosphorylase